jgi:predicted Zn finger-like uncharacterized protein
MILTCPNCSARFLVNSAALRPSGRDVRCGRCRHQWFAMPPADEPAEVVGMPAEEEAPAATPSPRAARRLVEPSPPAELRPIPPGSNLPVVARPPRRRVAVVAGWVGLALILIGIGYAIGEREQIMALYPSTRDTYAAFGFGIPAAGDGLQIAEVKSSLTTQEGVPVLVSEGRITNVSRLERHVPRLRGALRDSAGRELQSWTFRVEDARLAPGESAPFRTEVRQPAATATELSITFLAGD